MHTINFRDAIFSDLSSIIELLADDELGQQRENFRHPIPLSYVEAFKNINQDQNQRLVVITDESQEVIGTLQLSFIQYLTYQGGIRAQIEAVRIRKDKRGLGLGKRLFEWAIEESKKKGAHVVQLTTDKKRPEAIQFYKELGFSSSHEGMKLHLIN